MDVENKSDSSSRTLKTIRCPACGAAIPMRALGQSVMVACASCAAELDISQPDIQIISKFKAILNQLPLPLGTRGEFRGQVYEIVGAMERAETRFVWLEFLLFNPRVGFRWLINDQGHWSFGEPIKDVSAIVAGGDHLRYQSNRFRLFNRGTATVERVIGEFYWRATVGSMAEITDYIAPPLMLSKEKSGKETSWTLLHYVEPAEIEAAFKVSLPEPVDVVANQPNPCSIILRNLRGVLFIAFAAVLSIQVLTAVFAKSHEVPLGTIDTQQISSHEDQVFGPFPFPAKYSLNELKAFSALDNEWVELDYLLANVDTGQTYDFSNEFEFYSGYDSDGSWSEGTQSHKALLPNIPAGQYTLTVNANMGSDLYSPPQRSIALSLTHDVTPWRNFWLALTVIAAYPIFLLYRRRAFEKERWSNSNFNIYASTS